MILTSLSVRHFRGIRHARFDRFSDRLCLFYGPNESGKSTLVDALHFGLFERSAGTSERKRSLRSWGEDLAPEVEIGFIDDAGERWYVHKRFLDSPSTTVDIGSLHLSGDKAEAKLRELLGTKVGGRRGVTDEDLGIWPLLWVRQGEAGRATGDAINDDTRSLLRSTLSETAGALLAGPTGRRALDELRERHRHWWTPSGRPTAAFKSIAADATAADEALTEARDAFQAAQQTSQRLTDLQHQLAHLQVRIDKQQARAAEAKDAHKHATEQGLQAEMRGKAAELARLQFEEAQRREAAHSEWHQDVLRLQRKASLLDADVANRQQALRERQEERRALSDEVQSLKARLQAAAWMSGLPELTGDDPVQALERTLGQAESLQRQLRTKRAELDHNPVTPEALDRLRELQTQLHHAESQVQAACPQVEIRPLRPQRIQGASVHPDQPFTASITEPLTVELPGFGTLHIHPNRAGLASLQQSQQQATEAYERACAHLQVAHVAEATAVFEQRQELANEVNRLNAQLQAVAPDGVGVLSARLHKLQQRSRKQPGPPPGDPEVLTRQLSDAQGRLSGIEQAIADLHAELTSLGARQQTLAYQIRQHTDKLAELGELDALEAATEAAREHLSAEMARFEEAQEAFQTVGGADAGATARSEQLALDRLHQRLTQLREEHTRLKARLHVALQADPFGRLQEAEVAAEKARAAKVAAEEEAEAVRVAVHAVESSWRKLQETLAGPLRDTVRGYVHTLFPGSDLAIDEHGEVVGLRTGDIVEHFADLSGGAREQVGILVRLGLATLIARDRRLPVLLDDALVNSDTRRRNRMVEVLRQVSRRLQVLVFTCHDEDFDHMAAPWVSEVAARPQRG